MPDSLFQGVSAFPLTPITSTGVDEVSYAALVERLQAELLRVPLEPFEPLS